MIDIDTMFIIVAAVTFIFLIRKYEQYKIYIVGGMVLVVTIKLIISWQIVINNDETLALDILSVNGQEFRLTRSKSSLGIMVWYRPLPERVWQKVDEELEFSINYSFQSPYRLVLSPNEKYLLVQRDKIYTDCIVVYSHKLCDNILPGYKLEPNDPAAWKARSQEIITFVGMEE